MLAVIYHSCPEMSDASDPGARNGRVRQVALDMNDLSLPLNFMISEVLKGAVG